MEETAAADKVDPIHQFGINRSLDFGTIGGVHIAFTNSALFMVIAVLLISALPHLLGTSGRALVPGRIQSLAEISYEFVANMLRESAGKEGMRFFPFVFSLFMFVLFLNVLGLMPYFFTVTSHIVITAALALTVILIVDRLRLLPERAEASSKLFVPHGVPGYLLPLVVLIEVLSFLSRPISLSVRLFANMLAGHITLKVFASFILMLERLRLRRLDRRDHPVRMTVALTALEVLVAFLQAYVFAHPDLHVPERRDPSVALSLSTQRPHEGVLTMEADAAKLIGAGIACIGMGGAGVGLGSLFGHYLAGAIRNPAAADGQFGRLIFGFAVTEALGIFSLLIALLLIFAV